MTNKRKKTRAQQPNTVEGDIFSKKQSEKRSAAKRGLRKYQDPDVQVFQKLPGADGNINELLFFKLTF